MKTSIAAVTIVSLFTGAAALAHSGATGVVLERMNAMTAMGDAVKAVAPMMRGETAYDAAAVKKAAETIEAHSGASMTELFPEGSNGSPSEARDRVWDDWETFASLAAQMETAARGLALAAGNGLASAQGQMSTGDMMGGRMMGDAQGMMGGAGAMMGGAPMQDMSAEAMAAMPVDAAFAMTSQVCSACHTRFRAEDE